MFEKSDAQLLREYVENGDESAFREIVQRHADVVYSAAMRQVASPESARDIAQSVFCDLARKAKPLVEKREQGGSILGWLYRSTRFAALNQARDERRRQERERKAMECLDPASEAAPDWDRVQPILDEAMSDLSNDDREALLLRFFKNHDFRTIGEMLGVSNDAAQKRVSRALEKLRAEFVSRGVATTALALSTVLSTNAVSVSPAGMAAMLSAAALAGTTVASAATTSIAPAFIMTTLQKAWVTAIAVATVGTVIYQARQVFQLRHQVQELQRDQAPLKQQIAQHNSSSRTVSNPVAEATQSHSLSTERLRELLRLRGEVSMLRRHQRELEQTITALRSQMPSLADQSVSNETPPAVAAPFQVQLVLDEPGQDTVSVTNDSNGETLQVRKAPLLDHTAIQTAAVTKNLLTGESEVAVEFSQEGKELFAAITRENINKRLAIVLDGRLYSAPVIKSEIPGGKAMITGRFTEEEALALAEKINDMIRSQ